MSEKDNETIFVNLEKVPLKSEREEKKKKKRHVIVTVLLCVFFLLTGIFGGFVISYYVHPFNIADSQNTFGEIEAVLQRYWIYAKDHENLQRELEDKAFYGMTAFEEDPYTTYMSSEELQSFANGINMDYVGIGVQYKMNNNLAIIERVFANSPAEKAGFAAGDIIEKIDGVSVEGLSSDDIKTMVMGEPQTKVVITIIRNGKSIDLPVIRDSIDSSVYCYTQDDYVVMELSSFGSTTAKETMNYLNNLTDYEKIVIDVRNNSGGYQTSVKEIAGLFIGNNEVYLIQKDATGKEVADVTSCERTYENFKKIVILVNNNTASAAEVFAICLKEQLSNKVTLVGETTFGKGVIQSTHYLQSGGVLKFTSFNWLSPNGVSIHKVGIKPDVEIKQPDLAYELYVEMAEDEKFEYDSVSDVTRLAQMSLDLLGYDIERTDGYFDQSLVVALNQYKVDRGFNNDSVLDSKTYETIVSDVLSSLNESQNDYQFNKAIEILSQ